MVALFHADLSMTFQHLHAGARVGGYVNNGYTRAGWHIIHRLNERPWQKDFLAVARPTGTTDHGPASITADRCICQGPHGPRFEINPNVLVYRAPGTDSVRRGSERRRVQCFP